MKTFPKKLRRPVELKILIDKIGNYISTKNMNGNEVHSVASPQEAETGSIVFSNKSDRDKLLHVVQSTNASIVVASMEVDVAPGQTLIVVADPLAWYIKALNYLFPTVQNALIHPMASVSKTALVGIGVELGAASVIEDGCEVGDNCRIGSNCYLGVDTKLGHGSHVQNNVSIGGVGLGYHVTSNNERLFFPHLGAVLIGSDAVIGAGSVIVRGELEDTIIGDRTRMGNLVNIGHNVKIGVDCVISSSTCVAGGTVIGKRCNIAVGVSINAKLQIGNDCQIGLGSVVVKDVSAGTSIFGNPAAPLRTMRRF